MSESLLLNYLAPEVATVDHQVTLLHAAREMRDRRIGSLLVEKDGKPVGIVTETDIVRRVVAESVEAATTPVSQVMNSPILALESDVMPHEAFLFMAEHGIRHVLITQEGKILGMLSVRDLLRFFKDMSEHC